MIAVAMLFVSAPVAAQSSLWSATMTTGEFAPGRDGVTFTGYVDFTEWGSDRDPAGALSDVDFEFQGTTHTVYGLAQHGVDDTIVFSISPPLSEQDTRSFTLTADGQPLVMQSYQAIGSGRITQVSYSDPGFRWTVGQRVAVTLTAPTSTPALPLAGAGLLALLLGVGAYRRRRA